MENPTSQPEQPQTPLSQKAFAHPELHKEQKSNNQKSSQQVPGNKSQFCGNEASPSAWDSSLPWANEGLDHTWLWCLQPWGSLQNSFSLLWASCESTRSWKEFATSDTGAPEEPQHLATKERIFWPERAAKKPPEVFFNQRKSTTRHLLWINTNTALLLHTPKILIAQVFVTLTFDTFNTKPITTVGQ